jgi:circadian clock protein KaiC
MSKRTEIARIETGVRNLDEIFRGGPPKGSMIVLAGPPGSGKTILCQQICFHNASPETRVLYFNTLSEPTAKALRYLSQFEFFDPGKLEHSIRFVDLGTLIRQEGLQPASALILDHIKKFKPSIVVVDSFKVFDDLASSQEDLRKFSYSLAVNLMAWESTALLLGEYGSREIESNPLFSIVDGLVEVTQREQSGERQRFLHVIKMRGTEHSLDQHPFTISSRGIEILLPPAHPAREAAPEPHCITGVSKLDELLGAGIPRGSSVLVAGVAGTGKTILLLEFIYRGALAGERGLFVSFEETRERLLATARGLGWDLEREIARGMVELVFIPQPEIRVETQLLMIEERMRALAARRLAIDSVSVFLHKIDDPQIARDKLFQLAGAGRGGGAVGFFATDIPYGVSRISRLGVEETVADGVILLTSSEEGLERQRYIEVYKLRNAPHLRGRHAMAIGPGGISVFPRYRAEAAQGAPPIEPSRRLPSGVAGLDALLGGGLLERSVTLLAGSPGVGKSTLALQFVIEGAKIGERGIYFTLEEGAAQLLTSADALGLPLRRATEEGAVEIVHLSREHVRAPQFLSILADKITTLGARRLVLDGARHLISAAASTEELEYLLHSLVTRFKLLGATSVLVIESESLYSADFRSSGGLSPVADNLVLMRYARVTGRLQPLITVVKTRGSGHDRHTHCLVIEQGGMRVERPWNGRRSKRSGEGNRPPRRR